jgi:hypothetical protein
MRLAEKVAECVAVLMTVACAIVGPRGAAAQICPTQTAPSNDPSIVGEFDGPFVEPTVANQVTNDKCVPDPAHPGSLACKPAAVSIALLSKSFPQEPCNATTGPRLVYFNGLENTESIKLSLVTEFGQIAANDQTRVMTVDAGAPANSCWTPPSPVDAGANPNGADNEYLLPPDTFPPGFPIQETNGVGKATGEGALFCADLVQLADGKILAAGGTSWYSEPYIAALDIGIAELAGLKNTRIFDPASNTWSQSGDMHYARWYPSLVTLSDGSIFAASGVGKLVKPIYPDRPTDSGRNVTQTETYDPQTGVWTYNGPTADRSLPLYPRIHLLPNGRVYYDGSGQSFNPLGQSYDQALWNVLATYDPATKTWTDIGIAGLPLRFTEAGLGGLVSALNPAGDPATEQAALSSLVGQVLGDPADLANLIDPGAAQGMLQSPDIALLGARFRGSTFSIMMPLVPDQNGNYSKAQFLTAGGVVGGGTLESPGTYLAVPFSRIETIDIDPANPSHMTHSSRLTGSLTNGRWFSTGVLLPDGSVVAFNGADRDEVETPGFECPVQQTERFDPQAERWSPMANSLHPRTYHNTAILLPDGSVLIGGHAPITTAYLNATTIPGGFAPHDGRDPSFEIYKPPYFTRPRPVINNQVTTINRGQTLGIQTDDARSIVSAVLMRDTALTHLVDADQRSVVLGKLASNSDSTGEISYHVPSSAAVLPAGPYLLFIDRKDADGTIVPSVGTQVAVQ